MRKTSVYLTDDEAEGLRQLAIREGRPQAELIRAGIRRLIDEAATRPRAFRSLGAGRGGGAPYERWPSSGLHDKVMGKS